MRLERYIYLGLVLLGAFSIALVGWQTRQVSLHNCRSIEALKTQNREEALQSFARLDETLKALGVARTPGVVALAERSRDEKLARNRAMTCERGFLE